MLFSLTLVSNYIALAMAIWLGIYLVTHGSKKRLSLLTAFTLWSIGGVFLNVVLALSNPPMPESLPTFFRLLFPFWEQISNSSNSTAWLQGWSVAPAIGFWHHATVLFRPGQLSRWRNIRIAGGYLVGIGAIAAQAENDIMKSVQGMDPLYLSSLEAGPLFALFLTLLVLFTVYSLINLVRSAWKAQSNFQKKSLETLILATVVAGSTGPIMIVSSVLEIRMPILVQSLLLAIATGMMGYSVMRYGSVTVERVVRRDFLYSALSVFLMISIYFGLSWIAVTYFGVSSVAYIVMLVFAIFSFAGVDTARRYLDSLFYKSETRQMRNNLRRLADVATNKELEDQLSLAIISIASLVKATFAVLITTLDPEVEVVATHNWASTGKQPRLESSKVQFDDSVAFGNDKLAEPFSDVVLVVPLYDLNGQIGALMLGRPENGERYAPEDLDRLMFPSDQLAHLLSTTMNRTRILEQIPQLLDPPETNDEIVAQGAPVRLKEVEEVLRHVYDFAYLGNHKLGQLNIVGKQLAGNEITHIDRGKALNKVLLDAMEKLKPDGELVGDPPPRGWYAYSILHDAYVQEIKNNDIMSRLYISEGTFNRTRRAAIKSLSQALAEMESYYL